MTSRRFPDFYILGAPKAGTSSLAQYLDEHPGIFVSKPKEPRFFAEDFDDREIADERAYLELFDAADEDAILGEATTDYLVSEVAVDRILAKRPDAKFIVMLRNPIHMVPAMHAQERKNGYETVADPAKAWALLAERKAGRHIPSLCNEPKRLFYDDRCRLGEQMERLKSKVAEDRLLVIFMEDFAADTERVYREAQSFIGISAYEPREFPIVNQRHHIKHPAMLQLWKLGMTAKDKLGLKTNFGVLSKVQAMGLSSKPTDGSSPAGRLAFQHVLRDAFEADVEKLAALTGRDLSAWLNLDEQVREKPVAAASR
ncbi:MAG: sulfotransferase [Pseudomonadota bacterium]